MADVALLVALAWVGYGWVHQVAPSEVSASLPGTAEIASVNITSLAQVPLFGEAKKAVVAPKKAPVVPSTLKLELVGTVVADGGSVAIVKGVGNSQQVAMVGDRLQSGVVLREIAADSITIENQGRLERISLPKSQLAGMTATPIPTRAPAVSHARTASVSPVPSGKPTIPSLMQQARLVPHFSAGKVDGVLVNTVQAGSVFESMGLKSGDVVRSLNGEAMASPQKIMAMYRAVIAASPIDIELERSGQMRQIHYDAKAK